LVDETIDNLLDCLLKVLQNIANSGDPEDGGADNEVDTIQERTDTRRDESGRRPEYIFSHVEDSIEDVSGSTKGI